MMSASSTFDDSSFALADQERIVGFTSPAPLATVLENLPLVYNTEARSLHRAASGSDEPSGWHR
ncbi:hypothetical protein Tcan_16606 [Toxocara canis]|uniref:Uncharacterized protein n=1 Tax=Toxocara canis TaxID=6265 RepID=A0A0B2V201_TOXCA|nr:hypothetical protein Tcan_16606 [Toxocara canis]